jgi:hypothetical protein
LIQDSNVNRDDFITNSPPTPQNTAMSLRDRLNLFNTCDTISELDMSSLINDYNNLSSGLDGARADFASLTILDYDYEQYIENYSYDSLTKTINVNALEKLDAIIARYNLANPSAPVSRNLNYYEFTSTKGNTSFQFSYLIFLFTLLSFFNLIFTMIKKRYVR